MGSTPALVASTSASDTAAMFRFTMIWFASFVTLPAPGPPMSSALLPMHWKAGISRSKSAWSPPHMMARVPAMAPGSPPETGASTKPTPISLRRR